MKRFSFLPLLFLLSTAVCAQVTLDDFETSANTWIPVACGAAVADNPSASGLNLSCSVLCITRAVGCDNWSGAMYTPSAPISGYRYAHVLMYRNNTNLPNLKVYDPEGGGGSADLSPMNSTVVANMWQDVVFDLGSHEVNFFFLMVDRTDISSDAVMYVDDIVLSNDPVLRTVPNTACHTDTPANPTEEDYVLVWNEEFTDGALDRSAWNIEVNGDGGGNNELQYYCEKGVSIERDPVEGKQCLVLTARKEDYMGKTCTSGRVTTQDRTTFLHGKVEARIWFPQTANGLWPAFWMMGNDISSVGWPACGETDIVELGHSNGFNGTQDRYFNGASHWGPSWDKHYQYANSITNDYSVEDGFHIWTCIWDEEKVEMYVDRDARPGTAPYYRMNIPQSADMADTTPGKYFHKPNFLLLNLAIGGNFPGIWNINQITALQSGEKKMYIDWVRIYQQENAINLQALSPSDEVEGETPSEEAIRDTKTSAPTIRKQIQNGKIVIIRDNTKYDVLGKRINN